MCYRKIKIFDTKTININIYVIYIFIRKALSLKPYNAPLGNKQFSNNVVIFKLQWNELIIIITTSVLLFFSPIKYQNCLPKPIMICTEFSFIELLGHSVHI